MNGETSRSTSAAYVGLDMPALMILSERRMIMTTLTTEEMEHWTPILRAVWESIAYDVLMSCPRHSCRRSLVVEMACDAGRPCGDHGSYAPTMTKEEYRVLCQVYGTAAFKRWMRKVFPSNDYCI